MQRNLFSCLWMCLILMSSGRGAVDYIPLSEVRPGMTGTGKTCVQGKEIIEFDFEVLGILHHTSPGHNLVLIRLAHPVLDRTGVFAGMSGSPVYIGDRLLGAAAYSFPFSTEPVAGVTPFEEMQRLAQHQGETLPMTGIEILPAGFDLRQLHDFLQRDVPLAPGEWPCLPAGVRPVSAGRPIATPLVIRGASDHAHRHFQEMFHQYGFTPMSGGQSGSGADPHQPVTLEPGQGLMVNLVEGDLQLGAAGTVTAVDGDALYAFGHRFFDMGSTSVP
ncbi:MAG: hypothetical protein JXQ27_18165, partial [Acidobacteria bacterium]|nr:hypothetical protein [Acidobacteriota bacterium]